MSTRNYISLGIMTGTSLDGVDLSLIESDGEKKVVFLAGDSYPFDKKLRESIKKILGSISSKLWLIFENFKPSDPTTGFTQESCWVDHFETTLGLIRSEKEGNAEEKSGFLQN